MKIALFSDLHIFPHLGKNQFEDIASNFLIYLFNYCKNNNIKEALFLGDWFHLKTKLHVQPFIKSLDILRLFRKSKINLTFLIGNHDAPQMDSTDYSIIYAFKEYGTVIPLYDWEDVGDIRLHYLSYTHALPDFEYGDKNNLLFAHLDIKNFTMDNNFVCEDGFDEKSFDKFDLVFSGHFHKHQIKNNIVYIGSPYQTRFSERFDKKGFIVLDTDNLSWEFQVYNKAPVFKEIKINDLKLDQSAIKGNFIRIRTSKNSNNLPDIKNKILSLGAESVDFIFEDASENKEMSVIEDLSIGSIIDLGSVYYDNIVKNDLLDETMKKLIENNKIKKKDFIDVLKEIENSYLKGWKGEEA